MEKSSPNIPRNQDKSKVLFLLITSNRSIILPTVVICIRVSDQKVVLARALLDHCSQPNLIVDSFVKRNNIVVKRSNGVKIASIGNSYAYTDYCTNLEVLSRYDNTKFQYQFRYM